MAEDVRPNAVSAIGGSWSGAHTDIDEDVDGTLDGAIRATTVNGGTTRVDFGTPTITPGSQTDGQTIRIAVTKSNDSSVESAGSATPTYDLVVGDASGETTLAMGVSVTALDQINSYAWTYQGGSDGSDVYIEFTSHENGGGPNKRHAAIEAVEWIAAESSGAITIVGSAISDSLNGADVTLSLPGTTAENDVTVLLGGHAIDVTAGAASPVTSGYAEITQVDTTNVSAGAWWKRHGASPDSQVVGNGNGDVNVGTVYAQLTLRGVSESVVVDVTAVHTGEVSQVVNSPQITTTTDGALAITFAVSANSLDQPSGPPSGYGNFLQDISVETIRCVVGLGTKEVASAGVEDPGAFGSWDTTSAGQHIAFTIAIRPAGGAAPVSMPPISRLRRMHPTYPLTM